MYQFSMTCVCIDDTSITRSKRNILSLIFLHSLSLLFSRLSPKMSRKDRGRQLRSKRERAASPAPRDKSAGPRSRSGSGSATMEQQPREPVKEAMSPSVGECLRAVYAAFLWHEGIVHDAMACASFLKFHPNLPKELPKPKPKPSESERSRPLTPNITPTNSLERRKKAKDLASGQNMNINKNEVMNNKMDLDSCSSTESSPFNSLSRDRKNRHKSEGNVNAAVMKDEGSLDEPSGGADGESQLPITLQYLYYYWEEMSTGTMKIISQNLILPSPAVNAKSRKEKREKDKQDKDKKGKKARKDAPKAPAWRGNLFGEAAGGLFAGGNDRETMCELCGGTFPHPVTYHMRQAHPGCGRHAGGQGYNSGGNFCGGWAGNCGDGGIGGSSWYLICDRCREKYLRAKVAKAMKDKVKKVRKKSTPIKQLSTGQVLEPHLVMKNNAMFLLDLASMSGMNLPAQSPKRSSAMMRSDSSLPSVCEDVFMENTPFPMVPFVYLSLRGASQSDSAFAEEVILQDDRIPR